MPRYLARGIKDSPGCIIARRIINMFNCNANGGRDGGDVGNARARCRIGTSAAEFEAISAIAFSWRAQCRRCRCSPKGKEEHLDNRLRWWLAGMENARRSIRARLRAAAPFWIPLRLLLSTFITHRRRLLLIRHRRPGRPAVWQTVRGYFAANHTRGSSSFPSLYISRNSNWLRARLSCWFEPRHDDRFYYMLLLYRNETS